MLDSWTQIRINNIVRVWRMNTLLKLWSIDPDEWDISYRRVVE